MSAELEPLDIEFLNDLRSSLLYDQNSGIMTWIKVRNTKRLGTSAGCIDDHQKHKRVLIRFKNKNIQRSRLAFMWMTGKVPRIIDHINGNSLDDSWANLRECSISENGLNQFVNKDKIKKQPGNLKKNISCKNSKNTNWFF